MSIAEFTTDVIARAYQLGYTALEEEVGFFAGLPFFSGLPSGAVGGAAGSLASAGSEGSLMIVPRDPLVLDLDGDGVEFNSLDASNAYFDLNGDGFATRTSWLNGDDAFLVLDRNGDGLVNDITELFGSPERTGYEELSELDSNVDGHIDSSDVIFTELKIWQDVNGDGVSQSGELASLANVGIASVDLNYENIELQIGLDAQITRQSTFTWQDGSQGLLAETTGIAADVLLASDPTYTQFIDNVVLDPAVLAVGNIKGYGQMPDLHIAMSLNVELKDYILSVIGAPTAESLSNNFDQILAKWAGVEAISIGDIDPNHLLSVNPETGMVDFNLANESFSLMQLGVLKQYSGMDALSLGDGQWR